LPARRSLPTDITTIATTTITITPETRAGSDADAGFEICPLLSGPVVQQAAA